MATAIACVIWITMYCLYGEKDIKGNHLMF